MALTDKLTNIGNAIRRNIGSGNLISLDDMPSKIDAVYDAGSKVAITSEKANELTLKQTTGDKITALTIHQRNLWTPEDQGILFYDKNMLPIDDFVATGNGTTRAVSPVELERVFQHNQQYTLSFQFKAKDVKYSESGNLLYMKVNYTDGSHRYLAITSTNIEKGVLARTITTDAGKTIEKIDGFVANKRWTGGTISVSNVQFEKGTESTEYSKIPTQFVLIPALDTSYDSCIVLENGVVHLVCYREDGTVIETKDLTDIDYGQQLLALHTIEGVTNIASNSPCQVTYLVDRTLLGITEERERILGGAW